MAAEEALTWAHTPLIGASGHHLLTLLKQQPAAPKPVIYIFALIANEAPEK